MIIKWFRLKLTYTKLSAIGFASIIFLGAFLLSLPIASKSNEWTPFIDALFTAASATCITGLVIFDTYTHFSVFGHLVILVLIQIGGLGFMMIATMFALILNRRIGIRTRGLIKESVSGDQMGGVVRLAKKILLGTFIFESIGAVVLMFYFKNELGYLKGLYYGVFHSVSAFCNAGFDLMGRYGEFTSLTTFQSSVTVNTTIMILIVSGGLGFVVWDDIRINKFRIASYQLHTKMVLTMTAFLILVSAFMFYVFESQLLLKDLDVKTSVLSSLFMSITSRTAGFNTLDISLLSNQSKLLTMLLMFIGGSPGSTAGGVKTTTFFVMLLIMWSSLRQKETVDIYKRRLDDVTLRKAYSIISNYVMGAFVAILVISWSQPEFLISDIIFEVLSALGTVGMSTGITGELSVLSKLVIIILMYAGRTGSLIVLMGVGHANRSVPVKNPSGKVIVG